MEALAVTHERGLFRTLASVLDGLDGPRIGTHWHPQRWMVITSKVVVAIGFLAAAETASADVGRRQSTFETLTGECTKVILMDVLTDPAVCSDQVTAIRSGSGTLGYAFTIDSQGNPKPWIISFSGANLRHDSQNGVWGHPHETLMFCIDDKGNLCWRVRRSPHCQR
jgi:hypothetical protein